MVIMENLLLLRNPEAYMKNIRRYYNNKHKLNLILISIKHIIKLEEEKRKEEYMVLYLKQNATTGQIFMALFLSDATSSPTPPNAQSTPTGNLDELVMRLIPALTDHIVPVIVERVRELVSLPSH
nr:uncharacterized protein LOC104104963 [Nicotiana tomentosiformis]